MSHDPDGDIALTKFQNYLEAELKEMYVEEIEFVCNPSSDSIFLKLITYNGIKFNIFYNAENNLIEVNEVVNL